MHILRAPVSYETWQAGGVASVADALRRLQGGLCDSADIALVNAGGDALLTDAERDMIGAALLGEPLPRVVLARHMSSELGSRLLALVRRMPGPAVADRLKAIAERDGGVFVSSATLDAWAADASGVDVAAAAAAVVEDAERRELGAREFECGGEE